MNFKKILGDAAGWIFPLLLIGLFIVGAIHGKKKHNVDPFSANFFVCWYYGIEPLWHKTDYKELNDDVKVAVYLLMSKPDKLDAKAQLEFAETKKDFKKVIDKLDDKELEYVKAGVNTFIDFTASFQKDVMNAMLLFKQTKNMDISMNSETNALLAKCSSYGLEKEVNEIKQGIEKFSKSMNEKMQEDPDGFDESLIQEDKMKAEMQTKLQDTKSTYKEIFSL